MVAIVPAENTRPHVNLIRLSCEVDKLRANMKLNAAVSHKSHLLKVKSKFMLQKKLAVPNKNREKSDNLI